MRILHITERFGASVVGGAQQSVALLAGSQHDSGHEVGVVCVRDNDEAEASRVPFHMWRVPLHWASAQLRRDRVNRALSLAAHLYDGVLEDADRATVSAIREFKPDIVNTHILTGISDAIWRHAAQLNVPVVHSLRDFYLLCARSSMFRGSKGIQCRRPCLECRVITARRRRLSENICGFVGISQRIVELHSHYGAIQEDQESVVIPNAVSFRKGLPVARRAANDSNSKFVVGFMGRLVPTKGIEQLIRAFVIARMADAELRVAGTGSESYVERLKTLAAPARICFVGKTDAYDFLCDCDVLVVPSVWEEPFGRVIAEAMLLSVPVLCSNRGAFPELLRRFSNGIATNPDDLQAFVSALREIRDAAVDLRQGLIDRTDEIERYFSSESIAQQYIDFYGSIIARSSRQHSLVYK